MAQRKSLIVRLGFLRDFFTLGEKVKVEASNEENISFKNYEGTEYTDIKAKRVILNDNDGNEIVLDTDLTVPSGNSGGNNYFPGGWS